MELMKNATTKSYYTPKQLIMPLDVERIIEINDAVYSFSEIVDHIDLTKFLAKKDSRMGRPRYDSVKLLKEIRKTLNSAGAPLPGRSAAAMRVFILSAAPHMKGGIAAALDWAVLAYVVPHVRFFGLDGSILTDAAAALPRALTELTR